MSLPLIRYVLKAAIRDRLIVTLFLIFILGSCLSLFLGSAAVIEKNQFTLVFAAGGMRITCVLGLMLFVIFFIRRSFDGKEVEFLLSRPISRISIVLSLSSAFSILAIVLTMAMGLCIFSIAPHLFGTGHLVWIASMCIENIIIVNTALFFSMYIASATSAAMATSGFYVLSRMMGQLLGIVDSSIVKQDGPASVVVQFISVFMPRLDLLGQTSWLIYNSLSIESIVYVSMQCLVFCFIIISATLFDFIRRQF